MTDAVNILFCGTSFSVQGTDSYNNYIRQWMLPIYLSTYATLALNGHNTWSNLVRLSTALTENVRTIILDTASDEDRDIDRGALEAFIRRVWTYNPYIRIIGVSAPSWNGQDTGNDALVSTPTNLTELNQAKVIFDYYNTSYAAYLESCIALVPGTYHLNQLTDDTVHPNATGYGIMAGLVEAFLPNLGNSLTGAMPSRLLSYGADFEQTPVITNGTGYDSKTGVWTEDGTKISSVAPDATITFSGTFRSIGCYNSDSNYPDVAVSIDGGAYVTITDFKPGGYDIGVRAAHTVVIKVITTCKIDEFWAI